MICEVAPHDHHKLVLACLTQRVRLIEPLRAWMHGFLRLASTWTHQKYHSHVISKRLRI